MPSKTNHRQMLKMFPRVLTWIYLFVKRGLIFPQADLAVVIAPWVLTPPALIVSRK